MKVKQGSDCSNGYQDRTILYMSLKELPDRAVEIYRRRCKLVGHLHNPNSDCGCTQCGVVRGFPVRLVSRKKKHSRYVPSWMNSPANTPAEWSNGPTPPTTSSLTWKYRSLSKTVPTAGRCGNGLESSLQQNGPGQPAGQYRPISGETKARRNATLNRSTPDCVMRV